MIFINKVQNIKLKQIIIICVIVQLIVLVIALYKANKQRKIFAKIPQQEYMKDLIVTHYTESGSIKDRIHAKYWAYIPTEQISILEQPQLYVYKPNAAEWIVRSANGIAYHATLESKVLKLDLQNDVYIERLASSNFTPVVMKTSQLFYFPEEELLETDKFVEMTKPGLAISGIGLKSNLQDNLVTLLNKVNTRYVKESSTTAKP